VSFTARIYQLNDQAIIARVAQRFVFLKKLNCWVPLSISGFFNAFNYFGLKVLLKALVHFEFKFSKLNFSHKTLHFDKGRVWIVIDFGSNKVFKIYDLLAKGNSNLSKVSNQHYNALKTATDHFDATLTPQVFGLNNLESLGLAFFTTELYNNRSPITFAQWKHLRLKLVQPLVNYYFHIGVFCIQWKEHEALQIHEKALMKILHENGLCINNSGVVELLTQVHGDFQHFNVIGGSRKPIIIDWGGYSRNLFYDVCYQSYFYKENEDYLDIKTWENVYNSPLCQKFIRVLKKHIGELSKDEIIKQIAVNFYSIENGLFIDEI